MLTPALVLTLILASTYGCGDKQLKPKLSTSASENNYGWHKRAYTASYGEEFILDCTYHNTTNLIIQHDNKCLPTKQINETAIRSVLKPNLGKYLYTCLSGSCDSALDVCIQDNCCGHQLAVDVEPGMTVTAAGIRSTIGTDQYREYFVAIDQPYEVFCSSNNLDILRLKWYWELSTDAVNETTLVYHDYADKTEDRLYQCIDDNQSYQKVTVKTDFPPVAHEFECVLYHWRRLECSWQSYSERHKFKLYHTFNHKFYSSGYSRHVLVDLVLCADESGNRNISCKWFNRYKEKEVLTSDGNNCSFILQTCNDIYCNNQTFDIACNAITKLDVIYNSKVLNASSDGVFLSWSVPSAPRQFLGYKNFTYKIEYRLKVFGEKWRSAYTSTESCNHATCEYFLALPYPDAEYDGRVSMRFTEAGDTFFSAPASIDSISTEPRETGCCSALISLEDGVSCDVCELKEYTVKKSMALINFKSELKKKLDKIEIYTRVLRDLDSVRG